MIAFVWCMNARAGQTTSERRRERSHGADGEAPRMVGEAISLMSPPALLRPSSHAILRPLPMVIAVTGQGARYAKEPFAQTLPLIRTGEREWQDFRSNAVSSTSQSP
jgi:hypothetical protein